jgi:hypothetical protein
MSDEEQALHTCLRIVRDDDDADEPVTTLPAQAPGWRPGPRGPTRVVELDGVPRARWQLADDTVYLWNGALWRKELVGCVLCIEHTDDDHATLSKLDDSMIVCLEHGALTQVAYSMKKVYTISIGAVTREGEEIVNDTMLFPAEMTLAEQNELSERLLDEAQREEDDAGVVPDE